MNNAYSFEDSFKIYSPNYFGEEDNNYNDIHYLENEYLSLKFCTDKNSNNISLDLNCNGKLTELNLFKMKSESNEICYFSNYDLTNAPCDNFLLELKYKNKNKFKKIQRSFVKQKQSKLLNYVLNSNINSLSSLDLSYFLIVNNEVESSYSKDSLKVYNYLKNNRNNNDKCWNSNSCSVKLTSEILRNLKIAGYDYSSRLLDDGRIYIKNNLISNNNNPFDMILNISVNSSSNNSFSYSCDLDIDGELKNYIFNSNENISLSKLIAKSIDFKCNTTLDFLNFKLYNSNGALAYSYNKDNIDSYSYKLDDFACVGDDVCNFESSINTLIAFNQKIDDYQLILNYINSNIIETSNGKTFNLDNEYENSGKYLYYHFDKDLYDNLKFKQNNDGSWGEGSKYDRVVQTSWAILGIQEKDSNNEYVEDGKKWIYYNEPENGWGSIKKNALAYLAIKEKIKPYLTINSENIIKDKLNFVLKNPSIYDLKNIKINFDDNIDKYLKYSEDLGDLNSDDSINFSIKLNDNFFGKESGDLIITGVNQKGEKIEFIRFPINLEGIEPFEIINNNYSISEDNSDVKIKLKVNLDKFNFKCNIKNPFNNNISNININQNTKFIILSDSNMKEGKFETILNCQYSGENFKFPIKLQVNISKPSFELLDNFIETDTYDDFSVKLRSLVNKKQIVDISIIGPASLAIEPSEREKIIAGNDTRDLFFTIINKEKYDMLYNSNSTILIKSDLGYSKKIPLHIKKIIVERNSSNWILYLIIGVIFFITVVFVIRRYRMNQYEEELNNNVNNNDEIYFDDF